MEVFRCSNCNKSLRDYNGKNSEEQDNYVTWRFRLTSARSDSGHDFVDLNQVGVISLRAQEQHIDFALFFEDFQQRVLRRGAVHRWQMIFIVPYEGSYALVARERFLEDFWHTHIPSTVHCRWSTSCSIAILSHAHAVVKSSAKPNLAELCSDGRAYC